MQFLLYVYLAVIMVILNALKKSDILISLFHKNARWNF